MSKSKPYIPPFDSEETKFYVYVYIDPRTDLPFYIGKGCGKRAYTHLKETKDDTENKMKYAYIKGLKNKGLEPIIQFINSNMTSDDAYDYEEFCIWFWGRKKLDQGGILMNRCPNNRPPSGLGRACKTKGKKNPAASARMMGRNKNMTYEEIYGVEKAAEIKEKKRLTMENYDYSLMRYITNEIICTMIHKDAALPEGFREGKKRVNEEGRKNMSIASKKSPPKTEAQYIKMLQTKKDNGTLSPTSETRTKIKLAIKHRKRIMNVTTGEIFESMRDAARSLDNMGAVTYIANCAKGRVDSGKAYGYIWKFIDENNQIIET